MDLLDNEGRNFRIVTMDCVSMKATRVKAEKIILKQFQKEG